MKWLSFGLLAACFSVSLNCANDIQSLNLKAERQELLDTDRAWASAAAAGDVQSLTDFWADDAINYFPNAPVAKGREAIEALVRRNRSRPGFSLKWEAAEAVVAASGDLGYTSGTFELSVNGDNGEPVRQTGHYVCIWKKLSNGLWKCVVETSVFGPIA